MTRAVAIALLVSVAAGRAGAQPDAWARYHAATDAADRGDHTAALDLFRAARDLALEPALRRAACFGFGSSAHVVVAGVAEAARTEVHRQIACEGAAAHACFLAPAAEAPDPAGVATANQELVTLRAACPAPSVDRRLAWALTGGAGVALAGGGVLLGLAFSDAAEVRRRDRVGTGDLERRAELEQATGYGLLGLGAVLAGLATWAWLSPGEGGPPAVTGSGGLPGLSFSWR